MTNALGCNLISVLCQGFMGVSHSESGSLRQIQEMLKTLLTIQVTPATFFILYLCLFHTPRRRPSDMIHFVDGAPL